MSYQSFYRQLYVPLIERLGPEDEDTIAAVVGFDLGGPLSFCTFGRRANERFVTYVSCELAVRPEQKPNACGRYELLASCDSEEWVRSILSDTGRMSLTTVFRDGETMDIGGWVNTDRYAGRRFRKPALQGLLFKQECSVSIEGEPFGILRCIGITRPEMDLARKQGSAALTSILKHGGIYPHTDTTRKSAV